MNPHHRQSLDNAHMICAYAIASSAFGQDVAERPEIKRLIAITTDKSKTVDEIAALAHEWINQYCKSATDTQSR